MKTNFYIDDEKFVAGTTLKDETAPEANNMAFHACLNPETVLENRKRVGGCFAMQPRGFRLCQSNP